MLTGPEALIAGFREAADPAGIEGWPCPVRCETLTAPHERPPLPPDEAAVFVFTLSAATGRSAPCGPGTVLMVAKARANDEQWFQDAHYDGTNNPSTLAGSLLAHRILWPWLGIDHLEKATIGEWMLTSLDRTHFFIPIGHPHVRDALAVYVRGTAGSVFHRSSATGAVRKLRRAAYHQAAPGLWA
jgi:hypothetical protein